LQRKVLSKEEKNTFFFNFENNLRLNFSKSSQPPGEFSILCFFLTPARMLNKDPREKNPLD
jgi:hypothetical protein